MALTEEQKNCPYCHVGSDIAGANNFHVWDDGELEFNMVANDPNVQVFYDTWGDIAFDPGHHLLTSWGDGSDPLIIDIAYCPMCGRPLKGKEE